MLSLLFLNSKPFFFFFKQNYIKKYPLYVDTKHLYNAQSKKLDNKKSEINEVHSKQLGDKKVEAINEVQCKELDDKKEGLIYKNTKTGCRMVDDEILYLTCKRKKIKFEEDPKDSDSSSENENLSEVQKILSGKQKKDELSSAPDACTKVVKKSVQKYVFIGKRPEYKQKIQEKIEKNLPWYKRKSILSKSEDNSGDSSDLCFGK